MASDQNFVEFVMDQLNFDGNVSHKRMFGEYGLYYRGKIFALVCDNKLFIKPTEAGKEFIGEDEVEWAPPYPKAKNYFLVTEQLDNREWLQELMLVTADELPEPKKKKK